MQALTEELKQETPASPADTEGETSSIANSDSTTSTVINSHESFETFQHKVFALGAELGVNFKDIIRIQGGTNNRIIAVTIEDASNESGITENTQAILRIPRTFDYDSDDNKIPSVAKNDVKILDDAANWPNSIRFCKVSAFLSLADSFDDDKAPHFTKLPLKLSERVGVTTEVAVRELLEETGKQDDRDGPTIPTASSFYELIKTGLENRLRLIKELKPGELDLDAPFREKFGTMLEEMKSMGWFDTEELSTMDSVIYHMGCEPRNITVEQHEDSSWNLTGVVDWNEVLCLLPVLTRKPPLWLWDKRSGEDNWDFMPPEINSAQMTAEGAKIKEIYEQAIIKSIYEPKYGERASEVYHDDAYGRGLTMKTPLLMRRIRPLRTITTPFETFQHKITALGSELGVVFDEIDHMKGGSFNRVVPVTLRSPPENASWADSTEAIIRIPRVWDGDLSKIDPAQHGRTCKCDKHPERNEASNDQAEDETANSGADNHEIDPVVATEGIEPLNESQDTKGNASANSDNAPEENTISDTSDDSDISDISDVSSRRSLSKEPYRWEILDETALYDRLVESGLPAPRILGFDVGRDNELGLPYSIQTRLPEVTWISVIEDMPLESQLRLAEELVDIMARLRTVQFDSSGRLSLWSSLYDLLFYTIGHQLKEELQKVDPQGPSEERIRMFFKLQDIMQDMDHIGWFSEADKAPSKSVLHHWDLEARNILVEQVSSDSTESWRITGVIDWDHPNALPAVLTMMPPIWLWDASDDAELPEEVQEYYDNDFDWMPLEYYQEENVQHLNADGVRVKQRFEEAIVKKLYSSQYGEDARAKYLDDAYGRGRWLRRIWRFATEGIFVHPTHWRRVEQLDREWTEYKRANHIEYDHNKHADSVQIYASVAWPNHAREGRRSEYKGIEHDVAGKVTEPADLKSVTDGDTDMTGEDKVDTAAMDGTNDATETGSAEEAPKQKLPRTGTFSNFLRSFRCSPS
ncbi:hypothetical protein E4T47_08915 [Aureobasidium subglaciale]|nr:hypothetical protein E4T47_08915 [Aureobasidium subglaciale]